MFEPETPPATNSAGLFVRLLVAGVVVIGAAMATGVWWSQRGSSVAERFSDPVPKAALPASGAQGSKPGLATFADWPKVAPDMVLVFTGQTYGYVQPCGCSRPQYGGLERRFNLIQQLKDKGWPVVALDVGDMVPKPPTGDEPIIPAEQTFKKYEYAMKAYRDMGYAAVGLGEYEFKIDPFELLPRYALNNPDKAPFILCGNVAGAERDPDGKVTKATPRQKLFGTVTGKPDDRDAVGIGVVVDRHKLPFGVVGLVAPSVAGAITKDNKAGPFTFTEAGPQLKNALAAFAQHPAKPTLNVLLLQGNTTEAQQMAMDSPDVQIVACLSDNSEPPAVPITIPGTNQIVVQTGWKGRYAGVVGVFKTQKGLELKYQLVSLGEDYLTAAGAEAEKANKALQLLEEFAKDVKDSNLLAKYTAKRPMHPAQINHPKAGVKYVGSEACRQCHAKEFEVWSGHGHSHAYETLEKKAYRPGLQQFNGECLTCHTTGFRFETGFESKEKTPKLLNNGCENCHGPGSAHVAQPNNKDFYKDLSWWRLGPDDKLPPKATLEKYGAQSETDRAKDPTMPAKTKNLVVRISRMCMGCHDGDNDPKFDVWTYLPKIYHSGLKQAGLPGNIK